VDDAPDDDSPEARWERRAQVPLAVASPVFLAAYAVRVLAGDLPDALLDLCLALALAAWALFAVDYAMRRRLSGQRLRFVRTHPLDTVVLALPLLRPLRVVRLYEAVRRRHGRPRPALHARVIVHAGLSTLLLGFTRALGVYQQEHGAPDATIRTFGNAVWWTCATLATVGYGDVVPVTPVGRLIAVGMMAIGLALLGAVTGTFASWLLQVFSREDDGRPPGGSASRGPVTELRPAPAPPRPSRSSRWPRRTGCRSPASRRGSGRTPSRPTCPRRPR
jgi:voltage-gated potassium channel